MLLGTEADRKPLNNFNVNGLLAEASYQNDSKYAIYHTKGNPGVHFVPSLSFRTHVLVISYPVTTILYPGHFVPTLVISYLVQESE